MGDRGNLSWPGKEGNKGKGIQPPREKDRYRRKDTELALTSAQGNRPEQLQSDCRWNPSPDPQPQVLQVAWSFSYREAIEQFCDKPEKHMTHWCHGRSGTIFSKE